MFGGARECSGRSGRASGFFRAGSVAAPGRTRSGAPDAEVYASPRGPIMGAPIHWYSTWGNTVGCRRFVVDGI